MFGFFKQKKQTTEEITSSEDSTFEEKIYLKGTKISWHQNLIDEFIDEHKQLVTLFTSISNAYDQKDFISVRQYLKEFKRALIAHILKENILLYVYLKYLYTEGSINRELAKSMQKEMSAIGSVVFTFIQQATETNAEPDDTFKKKLDAIGKQLIERIQIEENSLYGLYVHPKMEIA